MFIRKQYIDELEQENEQLKKELEDLKVEREQQEVSTSVFFKNFYEELVATIEQHEHVNGQHHVLGDLVAKIKSKFDRVEELSLLSFNNSTKLYENGQTLLSAAEDMVAKSTEGKNQVLEVESIMKELGIQLNDTSEKMNHLNNRSKEIENIVQVIKEIAEQTNLLALNASIEAARAGEQGKGFSVVAAEVRKLAESTASSTEHISSLTKAIQKEIDESLHSTTISTNLVHSGVEASTNTTEKFNYIMSVIKSVQKEVHFVLNTIQEQKVYSQDVMNEISNTKELFENANHLITQHITDAKVVDDKLEEGMIQLNEITARK
ncbi:methyl-accepting chemotaxis protein [Bacillus timonensis]|uniref:methyl-accepting chemotaxis protein n=1 Tax=Bacillus timonensis TaxID=1033734 RepID=UPI00028A1E80|nr:methyl-accepting chemotaxis protein [Bacillus timonensis]